MDDEENHTASRVLTHSLYECSVTTPYSIEQAFLTLQRVELLACSLT